MYTSPFLLSAVTTPWLRLIFPALNSTRLRGSRLSSTVPPNKAILSLVGWLLPLQNSRPASATFDSVERSEGQRFYAHARHVNKEAWLHRKQAQIADDGGGDEGKWRFRHLVHQVLAK